jgi:hypothetical protein
LTTFRFPESLVSLGSKVHPSSASTIYWDVINFTDTYNLNSNTSYSNSTIKKVIFGKKVTVIPNNFCYNLDAITEIDIPNSVTQIGNSSFRDCDRLTTIVVSDSLESIDTYAFYDCISLESITLPKTIKNIKSYAFYYCNSMQSFYCKATYPPSLGSSVFTSYLEYIYVPISALDTYKALWNDYYSKIIGYNF